MAVHLVHLRPDGATAYRWARGVAQADVLGIFGREGLDFSTLRALQRDVEIEVFSTDKVGGFIGALYLGKRDVQGSDTTDDLLCRCRESSRHGRRGGASVCVMAVHNIG